MTKIQFDANTFSVDAALLGESLALEPSLLQVRMHERKITSISERGADEDAGRYRLTFFYENRRVRLIVDEEGNVIRRSLIDFGDAQRAVSADKPCVSPARHPVIVPQTTNTGANPPPGVRKLVVWP